MQNYSLSDMIYDTKLFTAYSLLLVVVSVILFISLSNSPFVFATHLELNTTRLTENMYVIHGSGGDVILSIGNDGIILVDSDLEFIKLIYIFWTCRCVSIGIHLWRIPNLVEI